jgi:AcrR family transcriptional regulator
MGSLERRSRERADTRQRILDAAREMFVRQGY